MRSFTLILDNDGIVDYLTRSISAYARIAGYLSFNIIIMTCILKKIYCVVTGKRFSFFSFFILAYFYLPFPSSLSLRSTDEASAELLVTPLRPLLPYTARNVFALLHDLYSREFSCIISRLHILLSFLFWTPTFLPFFLPRAFSTASSFVMRVRLAWLWQKREMQNRYVILDANCVSRGTVSFNRLRLSSSLSSSFSLLYIIEFVLLQVTALFAETLERAHAKRWFQLS